MIPHPSSWGVRFRVCRPVALGYAGGETARDWILVPLATVEHEDGPRPPGGSVAAGEQATA